MEDDNNKKYMASTMFNDGLLDIDIDLGVTTTRKEAEKLANLYSRAILDNINKKLFLQDSNKGLIELDINSVGINYKVCTKELGPPIDAIKYPEKIAETLTNLDESYMITEDDLKEVGLDKFIEICEEISNKRGYYTFDSVAYGVVEIN